MDTRTARASPLTAAVFMQYVQNLLQSFTAKVTDDDPLDILLSYFGYALTHFVVCPVSFFFAVSYFWLKIPAKPVIELIDRGWGPKQAEHILFASQPRFTAGRPAAQLIIRQNFKMEDEVGGVLRFYTASFYQRSTVDYPKRCASNDGCFSIATCFGCRIGMKVKRFGKIFWAFSRWPWK